MPEHEQVFAPGEIVALGGQGAGEPARLGEILEVLGAAGREHYRILWDDGRESILFPDENTRLHARHTASPPKPGFVPGEEHER